MTQTMEKHFPIVVGYKHRIAPVAAGHHLIECAGILEAVLPCHEGIVSRKL